MSRKKIYTTIGFDRDVLQSLDADAAKDKRSRSFILDQVLRFHYALPVLAEKEEEKVNADKS